MSGVTSQYGFSYQKEVFIFYLINEIKPGKLLSYEKIEDVGMEDNCSIGKINKNENEKIQVKSGIVSKDVFSHIIANWLVEDFFNAKFSLFTEVEIKFDYLKEESINYFTNKICTGKKMKNTSSYYKALNKYINGNYIDEVLLKSDIEKIVNNITLIQKSMDQLKVENEDNFIEYHCGDIVNNAAKKVRYEEFKKKIIASIENSISSKSSYELTYSELNTYLIKICNDFSDSNYSPDFMVFKKSKDDYIKCLLSSNIRYIQNLSIACNKNLSKTYKYILRKLFYEDLRDFYIRNDNPQISTIEYRAYENFQETKESLEIDNNLNPINLFDGTLSKKMISKLFGDNQEIYSDGCYIYLSDDENGHEYSFRWSNNND